MATRIMSTTRKNRAVIETWRELRKATGKDPKQIGKRKKKWALAISREWLSRNFAG